MTTIAAISLFRVQFRILTIPLVVIAVCLLFALIPVDFLRAMVGVAIMVCCPLLGPILFGAEYEEGSRDYIATRPVSQTFVFRTKVLLLALISFVSAALLSFSGTGIVNDFFGGITRSVGANVGVLGIWAVLFDIVLIGCICTVVTKDRIRGLLYGLFILLPLVWFLPFVNRWFFGDTNLTHSFLQRIHLKDISTVMSPLLVLPVLSMVYGRQLYGQLHIQVAPLVSATFFLSCLLLFRWSLSDEGKYRYDDSLAIASPLGWNNDGQIYSRPHPSKMDSVWFQENPDSEIIVKEDWSFLEPKLIEVLILPRYLPSGASKSYVVSLREVGSNLFAGVELRKERIHKSCLVHYFKDAEGQYAIQRVFFDSAYRGGVHQTSSEEVLFYGNLEPSPWHWPWKQPDTHLIKYNYLKGEVISVTKPEPSTHPTSAKEILFSDELPYGDLVLNHVSKTYFDGKFDWDIPRNNREYSGTRILNEFVNKVSIRWDGSIDLDLGNEDQFLLNDPAPLEYWEDDGLAVVDVGDPENPRIQSVSIPWKLDGVHRLFSKAFLIDYPSLGPTRLASFDSNGFAYLPRADSYFATLGGGYLSLWFPNFRRVAVWQVKDGMYPSFVGTSNTDFLERGSFLPQGGSTQISRVAPIQREDGALGYVTQIGILWLELPALMKEDNPS